MSASHRPIAAPPPDETGEACDVCGELVVPDDDDAGRAFFLWTRGEDPKIDQAPLCPGCAAALGLTALARWEIDEEEG